MKRKVWRLMLRVWRDGEVWRKKGLDEVWRRRWWWWVCEEELLKERRMRSRKQ